MPAIQTNPICLVMHKSIRTFTFLSLLFAAAAGVSRAFQANSFGQAEDPCSSLSARQQRSRYSALACWLQRLRLPLPDQSFSEGLISLSLKNLVCSNFSITGLESAYQPSENNSTNNSTSYPQLNVSLQSVSAICQGNYKSMGLSGSVRAVVGAHYSDTPSLQFAWTVDAAPVNHSFPQPVAIHTSDCASNIAVTDLKFSGSMSARTFELFAKQIRSTVTKEISSQLCPLVSQTLDPAFDQYINMINEWLEPYLSNEEYNPEIAKEATESFIHSVGTGGRLRDIAHAHTLQHLSLSGSSASRALEVSHHSHHSQETLKWSHDAPALVGSLRFFNKWLDYFLKRGVLQHWLPIFDNAENKPESCGFFFDGINSFIRSILYDNNGWMDLPLLSRWQHLHFVIPKYAAIKIQILNVSVHGLDHWDKLQLFEPSTDESFVTLLNSHNVTLRTRLNLVLSAVPDGVFKGDDLEEDFLVDLNATSLDTLLRFHLDADKSILEKNVTVGTVWEVLEGVLSRNSSIPQLPCLLDAINRFGVSDLSALWRIQSLSFQPLFKRTPDQAKSLEEEVDDLINSGMLVIWNEFPTLVTQSVKGLARGPVLDGLNAFFERITTTNQTCAVSSHHNYYPHLVDFTNVAWLRHMNDFFARSSTKNHINSYLQCGANYLSAAIQERIPNSLFQIRTLALENVGHLRKLEFLSPLPDGRQLSSAFEFGAGKGNALPTLDVKLDAGIPQASAVVNITVQWNEVEASSGLAIHYDLGRLKQYPLSQVMHRGQCLIVPTNEFDMYGVKSNLGSFIISLNASIDYGSQHPVFLNWTSSGTPDVLVVASEIWSWAVNSTRDTASLATIAAMSHANNLCQGRKTSYEDDGTNEDYLSITLVVLAILFLAQPAVLMIRNENDEATGLRRIIEEQQEYEQALMQPLPETNEYRRGQSESWDEGPKKSLIHHENIPDVIRVMIPILIASTIMLLACSNLSVGADVKLEAWLGGQDFSLPSLFSFSLYNTAKEMWAAKIYSLLLLVAVFSGLWPYLKLCLMLFGWLWPFTRRNARRRGRLFLALDALGKFSLVDTYVLVLMVVAFRYHLELDGGVRLDVFVVSEFGFYGFLMATILSLILSHALVFYHRRAEVVLPEDSCEERTSLSNHSFQIDVDQKRLSMTAKILLLLLFLCTCTLLAIGMTQKSFVFEFGGVAGELLGDRKDMAYSLISIGTALPESAEHSSGFGIRGLQAVYFFFAVAAPFACLVFLFILFICPLTLKQKLVWLTLAEIGNAWSAVEVFCLSIVAALLEISTFAKFIVGDKCNLIDSILEENFDEIADTCYSVSASVSWSSAYLVVGVLLNSFLVSLALRLAHTAVDESLARLNHSNYVDSLAAREASLVERVAGWKGMNWILLSQVSDEVLPLIPHMQNADNEDD